MNLILQLVDYVLHLEKYLPILIQNFGLWTYLILFFIIFMETGFVVTPFLPGDSLIFAATAAAALAGSTLHLGWLWLAFCAAAVLGDTANYWIGHKIGPRAFSGNVRFLKKEYLDRTHVFFEKYGGKTIIIARFVPIVRTFAPFVAGVGEMSYGRFITYNVVGGVAWVTLFTLLGYGFGNLPFIKEHFSLVVVAIVILSVMPAVWEVVRSRIDSRKAPAGSSLPSGDEMR
ncbi:MAG TPA: DedA family protein [Anaerolineales bacterium]